MNIIRDSLVLQKALQYIGAATVSYGLLRATSFLAYLLTPSRLSTYLHEGKHSWAFVSGASDGIGLGFSHELASRGFNLVLHGRNPEKLKNIQSQLGKQFPGIQTRLFIADVLKPIVYQDLQQTVGDIHLTLLVNNVGGLPTLQKHFMTLQEYTPDEIESTITLNVGFMTKITSMLLPALSKNEPSAILNISSFASIGIPWITVYSGTKGYVNAFSNALQMEIFVQGKNITVHSALCGNVQSAGNRSELSLFTPSSRRWASSMLNSVGVGLTVDAPYLLHKLQWSAVSLLPESILRWIMIPMMRKQFETLESKKGK